MVDLSRIGKNIGAENIAAAMAGAQETEKKQKKERTGLTQKGLGLEDIPHTPQPGFVEEMDQTEEAGETDDVLARIDQDLEEAQNIIKDLIAKKIKLADKHPDRQHELLLSAFTDCKNAYQKVKAVRDGLSST